MIYLLIILATYPDSNMIELVYKGQSFAYIEQFDSATVYFKKIITTYPDDPMGYLLMAGLLDLYMLDFSVTTREKEFFVYADKSISTSEKWIKRFSNDTLLLSWAHFYKGAALAYKALYNGRRRKFISAIKDGVRALNALTHATRLNPGLYDAYLGLGVYDVAMSELPKFLKWLPGFGDRKSRGISKIRLAAEQGLVSKYTALDALAWTLAYNRKPHEATKIAQNLLDEFPRSRTFRWTLGFALYRSGKYNQARETYLEILYYTLEDQLNYPYNIAIILYWIARIDYMLGKYARSLYLINVAKSLLRSEWRDKLKRDLLRDLSKIEKWNKIRLKLIE